MLRFGSTSGITAFRLNRRARVFEDQRQEQWHTIGFAGGIVLQLMAHTVQVEDDEEKIKIISARKAGPRERAVYDPLTDQQRKELERLARMPDSAIDLSDARP
jgi:uncharacterized DUF497 family protein